MDKTYIQLTDKYRIRYSESREVYVLEKRKKVLWFTVWEWLSSCCYDYFDSFEELKMWGLGMINQEESRIEKKKFKTSFYGYNQKENKVKKILGKVK